MIIFNSDLEDDIPKNVGWLFFNSDLEDDISKSVFDPNKYPIMLRVCWMAIF